MPPAAALGPPPRRLNPNNVDAGANSMWAAMGYQGPATADEARAVAAAAGRDEHLFRMVNGEISCDKVLSYDVVVVGSGCGGGVMAAELASAGKRVLVVEKGRYQTRAEMTGVEYDGLNNLFEQGGLGVSEDSSVAVLAGSTFGGGSAVNWACSLRTPDRVKQEWATEHGLAAFIDGTFDASLDVVCERVGVKNEVSHNRNNQMLVEGCKSLGYHIETAPQGLADVTPDAPGANFVSFGDRHAIKRSAAVTWLVDAATAATPAHFADRCYVERVLHDGGRAVGVNARIVGADGISEYSLTVRAPTVVVSCGSLHSPALLLRSGLPNRNRLIGKNLHLHPVVVVSGIVPKDAPDVDVWRGAAMTTVSNVVADGPQRDYYGARLECPLTHPGLMSSLMPWSGAAKFKEILLQCRRMMTIVVLSRDKCSGEIRIDKDGLPRIYYTMDDPAVKSLLEGVDKSVRIIAAAGAEKIITGQALEPVQLPPPSDKAARASAVESLVADVWKVGLPRGTVPVFSAHQMGSCRMGSDPQRSVVKPSCESWECSGLYVADASTFPTPSGTNPMITTYGIAHMAAQGIKRLAASSVSSDPPTLASRL
mmetsp:Transcript_60264/g.173894  ORF Transcript_60264/g.173894 Transcript_60264/m.173894 type:complete len:595 (-) Transcript_60264:344-2128(-)